MSLDKLVKSMVKKRERYQDSIIHASKNITYTELTSQIEFNPLDFRDNFKPGSNLKFLLYQGWLKVNVNPQVTGLYFEDILLKEFKGEEPTRFYHSLADQIKKAQQEEVVPF
ncbi:MAG: hypothetical protein AABX11_04180 [Nanoarchaeota archaeon]